MRNAMKRNRKVIIITFLIVGLLCFGISYLYGNSLNYGPFLYPKNGLADFYPDHIGYYKINPETIIASLDRGEINVFAPESATPAAPIFDTSFSWHQSDYLKITNAVFQAVWNETINSWSLWNMIFDTTCQDNPGGFESGDIHFFKADGESDYTTREVLITPQYGNVSWGGGMYFQRPRSGWKSIDLNRLTVTADDALRIAEENGGKSFRLTKQNQCSISLILNIDAYDGWRVTYQGNDDLSIFKVQIDPYTGKVITSKTFIATPQQ